MPPLDPPLLSFHTANNSLPPQSDNIGSMRGTKAISEIVNCVVLPPSNEVCTGYVLQVSIYPQWGWHAYMAGGLGLCMVGVHVWQGCA